MFFPTGINTPTIAPLAYTPPLLLPDKSSDSSTGWSSIIGIVTAICGNILISFALNTQRYAHLRLGEQAGAREEIRKSERKSTDYGTTQEDIADARARKNRPTKHDAYRLAEGDDSGESAPLIPSLHARDASTSSASGSSITSTATPTGQDAPLRTETSYLKSPLWWLGIGLMTLGEAGNFLAYGFAPASIVSPLGVVALISNCLVAPLMLHEPFRWRDGLGVLIAIAGCVTVVLSAGGSNARLGPHDIWQLVIRWEFLAYLAITAGIVIVLMLASNRYGAKTILIDLGLVGLFGGYTALSTKGIASLLSNTIWRVVTFPITYLLLAVLVTTAVLQIKYLNRALQHYNATMVIPTQFVLFTLSVIVGSAVLFREFEKKTAGDAAKFVAGCALTFLGVWCITSGRGDDKAGDAEQGEAGQDGINLLDETGEQPEIREREDGQGRRQSLLATPGPPKPLDTSHSAVPTTAVTPDAVFSLDAPALLANNRRPIPAGAANISAIHTASTDTLPNPSNDPRKPPPLHATTSAPVIPTITASHPSKPPTPPLNRNNTTHPTTPPNHRAQHARETINASSPSTPPFLTRHSMAGILPGPLTSPLSSSLSAIVADSLRRGVDSPPFSLGRKSLPRRQQQQGGKRSGPTAAAAVAAKKKKRASVATIEGAGRGEQGRAGVRGPSDGCSQRGEDPATAVRSGEGRGRSLSATLGELFSSRRAVAEAGDEVREPGCGGGG